jgi:hypothetical protein
MARQVLRPKEAQRRLGVGHTKFYADYINTGKLRLVRLVNGVLAFSSMSSTR